MVIYILLALTSFLIGLLIKDFFPTYMRKKGENLATKEDISDITQKTEEVKQQFQKEFAIFSATMKFRSEYTINQYVNLYAKLYINICQSEYCRKFIEDFFGDSKTFEQFPYIQPSPTRRVTTNLNSESINRTEEIIETDISSTNKKLLYELIIDNSQYASQELLKIAVAYRFIHSMYGPSAPNHINEEELRLLKKMLTLVVLEYNTVRKAMQLDYNEEELSCGFLVHQF